MSNTTLIISDLHLTPRFNQKTFQYLTKLLPTCDQVIINGDFWDGYLCSFESFVSSRWHALFPLLRAKNAIYLYGNHDQPKHSDHRVELFSTKQAELWQLHTTHHDFIIQHGQDLSLSLGENCPSKFRKAVMTVGQPCLKCGVRLLGPRVFYQLYPFAKRANRQMKRWAKEQLQDHQILVCGHSHLAAYDLRNKFINSGFIQHTYSQYVRVNGKIDLVRERY